MIRVPVVARISKGVLMPSIGAVSTKLVAQHNVLSLHLPQLDASGIALRGRVFRKPTVLTYHSDLVLPPSSINRVAKWVVDRSNEMACLFSDVLCSYTQDFARHSPFLSRHMDKVHCILPPVEMAKPSAEAIRLWAAQNGLESVYPVIGVAVRLSAEKGIEYLLQSLPAILNKYPGARVLHAGPVEQVIGEEDYHRRLQPLLDQFRDCYTFLGALDPEEMPLFFSNCDVHVLPSINSTETFGLVQIEAALCGTPTVASDLPGVRVPTQMTEMGLTVPPRNPDALAAALLAVLANPQQFRRPRDPIARAFSPDLTASRYEELFCELRAR